MPNMKIIDIVLLISFPIIAVITSLALKANFFLATLLFFGVPAAYLSLRTKDMVLKALSFAGIFAVPVVIVFDYVATVNKAWHVTESAYRIFGVIPIEDFVWAFLLTYFIVIFYEHFLDKGVHEVVDRRMKYLVLPLILVMMIFFTIMILKPEMLYINYAYLLIGIWVFLIPSILFIAFHPNVISKYMKITAYFFCLGFLNELTGLQLNHWYFPGDQYIGMVNILGHSFPYEEFFFYFVLVAVAVISYYEFFDDDRK